MPRGHRICGSSNYIREQGKRREGNVWQVDENFNMIQINKQQGSQGHEREGWVIGGCGRGLSECQGNASN